MAPRAQRRSLSVSSQAAVFEELESRQLLSTSAPVYLVPTAPGVEFTPLITTGDTVNGYRMAGIPDGLGAYDNGDGTFTVLMNHELTSDKGIARAHGAAGSFISKWVIDKKTLQVLSGSDLIQSVYVYNTGSGSYEPAVVAFNRFCSANLAEQTAFYSPVTGRGTQERIFTNGQEFAEGSAFAHVVSTGQSYELPWLGNYAFENVVASPFPQDLTIVGAQDDSNRLFTSEGAGVGSAENPSEVYFYLGTKKSSGSVIDRAGLTGGILTGLRVGQAGHYEATEATVTSGERFDLSSLGDVSAMDAAQLENASIAAGVTQFRRPEDGAWDPNYPNIYYFVTTDSFGGDTRLWKLTFDDITHPEKGGVIQIASDNPGGAPAHMFDNVTVNYNSDVLIDEDPGNQAYLAKLWQYDSSTGDLIQLGVHNPDLFQPGAPHFMTQDEESSGVLDISKILGPGYYLLDVQAHLKSADPELVEGGQLLLLNTNAAKASLTPEGLLNIQGTVNDDNLSVSRKGQTLSVNFNGKTLGTFPAKAVRTILAAGFAGSDLVGIDGDVQSSAVITGGLGDDILSGPRASSILIGGAGSDLVVGGSGQDIIIGDIADIDDASLLNTLSVWNSSRSLASRVASLFSTFGGKVTEDGSRDILAGRGGKDWYFDSSTDNDVILGLGRGDLVS